jgi:hypothetical protein
MKDEFIEEIVECIKWQYPRFYYKLISPISVIITKHIEKIEKKAYRAWYELGKMLE